MEAAFVFPMFLIAMLTILSFAQVIKTELSVIGPLHQTGRKLAQTAYLYERVKQHSGILQQTEGQFLAGGLTAAAAKQELIEGIGKKTLETGGIVDGVNGISLLYSKLPDEDGMIDLVVSYRISLPFQLLPLPKIPVAQRCRVHEWIGYEAGSQTEEQTVYVTENGAVYHLRLTCTHLKLSIRQVDWASLRQLRNTAGGKYYPCQSCKPNAGGPVYITTDGTRYHGSLNCSGLKRGVREIPLSQVGELPLCSRCRDGE